MKALLPAACLERIPAPLYRLELIDRFDFDHSREPPQQQAHGEGNMLDAIASVRAAKTAAAAAAAVAEPAPGTDGEDGSDDDEDDDGDKQFEVTLTRDLERGLGQPASSS